MARVRILDLEPSRVVARLPASYAHIGVYDVRIHKAYAARNDGPVLAIDMDHAQLLRGSGADQPESRRSHNERGSREKEREEGGGGTGVAGGVGGGGMAPLAVKDRFVCFWFYPPRTREGLVLGYPIDWTEHNLLVRLDPYWSYVRQTLLPAHQTAAIEANIDQQLGFAAHLLQLYRAHGLQAALSVHLIGPRPTDSLFYAHRWEPKY